MCMTGAHLYYRSTPTSRPRHADFTRLYSIGRAHVVSTSRMLKKTASIVLASLRVSTYRSVRLASSLAAALLDGLFEHPAGVFSLFQKRAD